MIRSILTVVLFVVFTGHAAAQSFSYQGRLGDNGAPANGAYDIAYSLYTDEAGGTAVISEVALGVQVTDGLFTALFVFPDGTLTPATRWLGLGVRAQGGGAFTAITGRTFLAAAPFASVDLNEPWQRPQAGTLSYGGGFDTVLINRDTPTNGFELLGVHGEDAPGFMGINVSGSNPDAIPFYGYVVNGGFGAYHYFDPATDRWRLLVGSDAITVRRSDQNIELLGPVSAAQPISAPSFEYNSPKTHTLTLGPADFLPDDSDSGYSRIQGIGPAYITSAGAVDGLSAPVHLPNGAVITRVTIHYYDNSTSNFSFLLVRNSVSSNTRQNLIDISGNVAGPFIHLYSAAQIDYATIDNDIYYYYFRAFCSFWPGDDSMAVRSVVIEYTTTQAD